MRNRWKSQLSQVCKEYYLLVNANNCYWEGNNWTTDRYKAKRYLTLTTARSAQSRLKRQGPNF
ncbi:hypothetical protein [Gloeothece verrucosa]|uniref:Uncharacterized protein n=1 Tax=Gloeothece verrucosa (strain PCC 7822) TaxID=497965 RepID=E0UEM5_GLOV7|nr:hypothetical protein [Gloeothece verrucosa]ADN16593.1 hypothetical protein Cyan7822_4688 [Gloeothece verrucosa PCC 7822]